MTGLTIIVAATKSCGIGHRRRLPWHIRKDLEYFSRVTTHAPAGKSNAVIMGRGTWESIPDKYRPLPGRQNVVLSHNPEYRLLGASSYVDLKTAIEELASKEDVHRVFIIGGTSVYEEVLQPSSPFQADRILLTRIDKPDFTCDTFISDFRKEKYGKWQRATHEELIEWTGLDPTEIPRGVQEENSTEFEFQMWKSVKIQ